MDLGRGKEEPVEQFMEGFLKQTFCLTLGVVQTERRVFQ